MLLSSAARLQSAGLIFRHILFAHSGVDTYVSLPGLAGAEFGGEGGGGLPLFQIIRASCHLLFSPSVILSFCLLFINLYFFFVYLSTFDQMRKLWQAVSYCDWVASVAYRGGVGELNLPPKFRRPSKIVRNPARL